jgi:hypothetical protein
MIIPKQQPKRATQSTESMMVVTIASTQRFPALKAQFELASGSRSITGYVTRWSEVEGAL